MLEAEFALIREAIEHLRAGSDLGFGSMADPEAWLACLAVPGSALSPTELLDSVSLMDAATSVRLTFKDTREKYPRLTEHSAALGDFRSLSAAIRRS